MSRSKRVSELRATRREARASVESRQMSSLQKLDCASADGENGPSLLRENDSGELLPQTVVSFRRSRFERELIRSALSAALSSRARAKTTAINASIIENNAQTKLSSRQAAGLRDYATRATPKTTPFPLSCRPF